MSLRHFCRCSKDRISNWRYNNKNSCRSATEVALIRCMFVPSHVPPPLGRWSSISNGSSFFQRSLSASRTIASLSHSSFFSEEEWVSEWVTLTFSSRSNSSNTGMHSRLRGYVFWMNKKNKGEWVFCVLQATAITREINYVNDKNGRKREGGGGKMLLLNNAHQTEENESWCEDDDDDDVKSLPNAQFSAKCCYTTATSRECRPFWCATLLQSRVTFSWALFCSSCFSSTDRRRRRQMEDSCDVFFFEWTNATQGGAKISEWGTTERQKCSWERGGELVNNIAERFREKEGGNALQVYGHGICDNFWLVSF